MSIVMVETWREYSEILEAVDASDCSDGASLSEAELSSRCSSGMDSTRRFCDDLVVSGRMTDQGGDSCKSSRISTSRDCESHCSNFFATHGF